jgi:hypothetical protein
MNFPNGTRRITTGYNPSLSGQKNVQRNSNGTSPLQKKSGSKEYLIGKLPATGSASKHGKGSILYSNVPIKIEGDLMFKNQSRDNSKPRSENNRSVTPNRAKTSPIKFSNNQNIKNINSLIKNNIFSLNLASNKTKKIDLSTSKERQLTKKTQSYYIPKSARDNLNLSSISGASNKNKLIDLKKTDLNKSKLSELSKTSVRVLSSSKPRSFTPNPKSSRNTHNIKTKLLTDSKLSKSNNDFNNLSPNKFSTSSKSPKPSISRSFKNTPSPISKKPFDSNLIKQLNDFKNNKSPTPHILKKLTTNKIFNKTNTKFGMQNNIKKVITGNLVNMNMQETVLKDTLSPSYKSHKEHKEAPGKVFNNHEAPLQNQNRTNYHKERESKGVVDFKEITTSPLLRVND